MKSPRFLQVSWLLVALAISANATVLAAKPFGLDRRVPWTDSKVAGSPDPLSPYKVVRAFPKLSVKQPLLMTPEPGTKRLFILQHLGHWSGPSRLLAVDDSQDASTTESLLEVRPLVLGVAIHPNYAKNGYIYLGLNGPSFVNRGDHTTQVVRYTVDRKPPYGIDPASRTLIIEWLSNGHDGGDVAFGNDGTLFASAGDGTSDSDGNLTGQRIDDIPGSVIRIDVDHPDPGRNYSVPKDNPFVSRPGARPEVWAYGLRNPWRLSYDKASGQLWAGNNGQDLWEQVYLIQKGGNYGWSLTEGSNMFHAKRKPGADPILPPTGEHSHSQARSITGGRVYRGPTVSSLDGVYVYGDWSTGRVWGIKHDGKTKLSHQELVDTPFNITGFGTDHSGEMYLIDHGGGFYRFTPTTEADKPKKLFPTRLTETGLFTSVAKYEPTLAAIPYDVIAPQWADGATITRFAALPGTEKIIQEPQKNAGGAWTLPNGSVLVQTLSLNLVDSSAKPATKRIETQLLVRQQGEWTGYSYKWNSEQTDATLVAFDGDSDTFEVADTSQPDGRREQVWRYPARTECLVCHSRAAGFLDGFTPLQLDRDHKYGAKTDNQLRTLENIGLFEGPLPPRKKTTVPLVNPYDTKAPLLARVKSYLEVNCSTCHVKEGGGNSKIQLGLANSVKEMVIVGEVPSHTKFDIADALLVYPGSPEKSVLYQRISRRGTSQMPPLGSTEVDQKAVEMIGAWIRGLPPGKRPRD
jgi:uncharacterized repeat protein (TIGR03806 family)